MSDAYPGQNPFMQFLPMTGTRSNPLLRDPTESESAFFRENPNVGGYASPDGRVVLNPFSTLSDSERSSIIANETYRAGVQSGKIAPYQGTLTPEQTSTLDALPFYSSASPSLRAATVMGRALSGDPSSGSLSPEQVDYLNGIMADDSKFLSYLNMSENGRFFHDYHNDVLKRNRQLIEDGQTTTMRIESVGLDGKTFLIPTYDPETMKVLDINAAVDRAIPFIKEGKLKPYDSPDAAEQDRMSFYPLIVGSE